MKTQETGASAYLEQLLRRYVQLSTQLVSSRRAEGRSNETEMGYPSYAAYAVTPTISSLKTARDKAYFVYFLIEQNMWKESFWLLYEIEQLCLKHKDGQHEKIACAISFLLTDTYAHPEKQLAAQELLQISPHSWFGNGCRRIRLILSGIKVRMRVLQTSKVTRGVPSRPKERSPYAHDWLPGWEKQYIPRGADFEESVSIIDLLSPTEILLHVRRLSA